MHLLLRMLMERTLQHVIFVHVFIAHDVVEIVIQFFIGVVEPATTASASSTRRAAAGRRRNEDFAIEP